MRTGKFFFYFISLIFISNQRAVAQTPDPYFCDVLQAILADANNQFIEQTGRERVYMLGIGAENRFESHARLPGFNYAKIISMGLQGLFYESMAPYLPDSQTVLRGLKEIDTNILACVPNIVRRPQQSKEILTYSYQNGDTTEDILIRLVGVYPSIDADSFFSPGQLNIEIYGDARRKFTPYKPDPKKKDSALTAKLLKIEKGLFDDIKTIQGRASKDLYDQPIWIPNVTLPGATYSFLRPLPEEMGMSHVYYAEFYMGENLEQARAAFKKWDDKLRNNAFVHKKFKGKNFQHMQWHFLPYNEWFDPNDYANIIEQKGYSCPNMAEEPFNRVPLFTYHLFIMKYIDAYIVGVNISNRY